MKSTIDSVIDELRAVQRLRLAVGVSKEGEYAEEERRIRARENTDGISQRATREAILKHCFRLEQAAISHILTALDGGARPGWDGGQTPPQPDYAALALLVEAELERIRAAFNKHDNGSGRSGPTSSPASAPIDADKVKPK